MISRSLACACALIEGARNRSGFTKTSAAAVRSVLRDGLDHPSAYLHGPVWPPQRPPDSTAPVRFKDTSELDAAATTAERVRAVLLELLPANTATIEKAAERLGLSKRTLQRRLEEEGENFRALVNTTRESLARHYLGSTTMTGGEIAFLLGFEDPNSFYRAFLEWTGQTPDTARSAMRRN